MPQRLRVTEAEALIPAVSNCWDSSPHEINYSAEQKVGESWEGLGREALLSNRDSRSQTHWGELPQQGWS